MDKPDRRCYNPIYKVIREVMNWGHSISDIADHTYDGGGDGLPGDADQ